MHIQTVRTTLVLRLEEVALIDSLAWSVSQRVFACVVSCVEYCNKSRQHFDIVPFVSAEITPSSNIVQQSQTR